LWGSKEIKISNKQSMDVNIMKPVEKLNLFIILARCINIGNDLGDVRFCCMKFNSKRPFSFIRPNGNPIMA
jgi:hypothetical protein